MYVSHLILYLRCKFHGNIPNDCQDFANLLLGYFNLGHPVVRKTLHYQKLESLDYILPLTLGLLCAYLNSFFHTVVSESHTGQNHSLT